jgi:hypothetical protein
VQGSQVGKVTAVDGDKGANADISYDLVTEWGKEVFSLDPATGIFTLTAELDYERTEHYIFVVSAADNGSPAPLSSTVTVYINVKDVNDNAPVFGEAAYAAAVAEDVAVGASILQVGFFAFSRSADVQRPLFYCKCTYISAKILQIGARIFKLLRTTSVDSTKSIPRKNRS